LDPHPPDGNLGSAPPAAAGLPGRTATRLTRSGEGGDRRRPPGRSIGLAAKEIWMQRRTFIVSGGAALIAAIPRLGRSVPSAAGDPLAQLERQLGGRIGLAAVDTGSGARLAHRADERFAMCSTFKWLLAAATLARIDDRQLILERKLAYGPADLLEHSPVTSAHVSEGALSIRMLCEAAVEVSDNTAANLLLNCIGGPPALTRYARQLGDRLTRLDRMEPEMSSNRPGDARDTTTAHAMAEDLRGVLLGDALRADSRRLLTGWLENCQTGHDRLRAGLPGSWVVGDKTGTGPNGAVNDIAIAWPPRRPPILIAAYLSGSPATPDALNAAHARIGRIVAAAFG
jgi:beta-lactamase class A